jgi:hypothetical protein
MTLVVTILYITYFYSLFTIVVMPFTWRFMHLDRDFTSIYTTLVTELILVMNLSQVDFSGFRIQLHVCKKHRSMIRDRCIYVWCTWASSTLLGNVLYSIKMIVDLQLPATI